jgi:hypothetical protein
MTANTAYLLAGMAGTGGTRDLVWVADAATAVLPTDSTTALDAGFSSIGLVTPDGATTSTAVTANDIPSFGSYSPSRTLISAEVITLGFTAQETNKVTAAIKTRKALTGITVTTGAMSLTRGPARDALYALVVDMLDGASNHIRKVYPSARLTAFGDQQVAFAAGVFYGFTFTCYPDSLGNTEYEYDKVTGLT